MEISARKVHDILKSKGVTHIHHANSVITSCQFLRYGALLSRGTIERRRLYQTSQGSDKEDQKFGLWFDVFTDSVDIHDRAKRANVYGPVLFVLSVELIAKSYIGKVWVTKLNPTKWEGRTHEDRWFTSADDLKENFVKGRFDQMIVFRHSGGELPIKKYLQSVVLDDPHLVSSKSAINYYSMAYGALKLSMTEGDIHVPIVKRECAKGCTCTSQYKSNKEKARTMYVPKV
jgi:hypothetical protein